MDLDPRRIEQAQRVIDPVFRRSPQYVDPQLCRELDRVVVVKDETRNPLQSFKGRGAGCLLAEVPRASHLVCASSGNFGQARRDASRPRSPRAGSWRTAPSPRSRRGPGRSASSCLRRGRSTWCSSRWGTGL